jgi:hypothetical protein
MIIVCDKTCAPPCDYCRICEHGIHHGDCVACFRREEKMAEARHDAVAMMRDHYGESWGLK